METIRYSDSDLAEFKELIDKKMDKARQELDYLQEQIVEITENADTDFGGDYVDDSSTNSDVEMLNNMAIRQRKYIRDLENALLRIQNRTYGICVLTGELIDKKRLMAVPTATKSLQAKLDEQAGMGKPVSRQTRSATSKSSSEKKPKVITKVIRKSTSNRPPKDLDEEFDEIFGKDEDDLDTDKDINDDNVDLDQISEDDLD